MFLTTRPAEAAAQISRCGFTWNVIILGFWASAFFPTFESESLRVPSLKSVFVRRDDNPGLRVSAGASSCHFRQMSTAATRACAYRSLVHWQAGRQWVQTGQRLAATRRRSPRSRRLGSQSKIQVVKTDKNDKTESKRFLSVLAKTDKNDTPR